MTTTSPKKSSWISLAKALWFLLGLGETRKKYTAYMAALFVILFYAVVPPIIIGMIVNFFAGYKSGDPLDRFYLLAGTLAVSMIIVSLVRLSIKNKLSLLRNETAYQIKIKGFEFLASQSLLESFKKSSGEKAQRIQNGIDSFTSFFHVFTNRVLASVSALAGTLIVFFYLRFTYALFFIAYTLIFSVILKIFTAKLERLNFERNIALEKSSGVYVEGLSNISTLKSLGSEESFQTNVSEREELTRHFSDKIAFTSTNQWKTFQVFNGLSAGIFLLMLGGDVLRGLVNIGEIVIFYSYLDKLISMSDQLMSLYGDIVQAKSGILRMAEIFRERFSSPLEKQPFPEKWERLTIKGGCFSYRPGVGIQDADLEIRKGQKVGIVGQTGSGKSTLARILLGLFPLEKGAYRIDDKDFYLIDPREVFKNISVIPQEIEIFKMSLRENITLFKKISEESLQRAVKIAQLEEVVVKLPEGLETIVGEKGYRLSGGERQRVAIARALCRESQMLILDEATSALDTQTEALIYEGIEKNFPEKTLVIITHRIGTLQNADRIYRLDNGKISESTAA